MNTNININEGEVALLAHLHEHVTGFTRGDIVRSIREIEKIAAELGINQSDFYKATTYLAGFGLVHYSETPPRFTGGRPSRACDP